MRTPRFTLAMGQGEIKSFAFKIRALEEIKGLVVAAYSEDFQPDQVEVFGIERIDVSDKATGKTGYWGEKLVPLSPMDMKAGEDRDVWVRIRTGAGDEGKRRAMVRVTLPGREPHSLEVLADIRPILLPRPNLISLEAEHSTMILPGCWNAVEGKWNLEVVERYTRDLGEHLVDLEQGFWGWFGGPRDNGMIRLATTGETLQDFLKKNPDLANPPPLDFSYLNPIFDAAIRHGMIRFSGNSGGELPPKPVNAWVMREAARYLRDRGYPDEDIWCKHRDEQPSTNFPAMVQEVQWLRANGYRPFSTFHNLLAVRDHLQLLNPAFDMFQGGFTTEVDREARFAEGVLDRADEIWMYQGWGATWISYEQNRRPGWLAAAAKLDGYHVHVYYRWNQLDAVIFPSDQGPSGTPAWEGMRDGMADAQYVALARRWIDRLGHAAKGNELLKSVVVEATKKLEGIVGAPDSIVPLEKKRDRLVWVEHPKPVDIPTADKARAAVLDLLVLLRPYVRRLGPTLYYGNRALISDDFMLYGFAKGSDGVGLKLLSKLLDEHFQTANAGGWMDMPPWIIDLRVGQLPADWAATQPHITELYPGPGEYVIHVVHEKRPPARLLIFGRDVAGLEKGIRNWVCFLRGERRATGFMGP